MSSNSESAVVPAFCGLFLPTSETEPFGLTQMLEDAPDATLIVEINSSIVAYANPAAGALLRLPRAQIIGSPLNTLGTRAESRACIEVVMDVVRRRGNPFVPEIALETDDGTEKWLVPSGHAFRVKDWSFVQCTFRDVTESRKDGQRAETRRRFDALQRLGGGLSHDFNNMLTCIRGYSSIILETPGLPEDVREMIGLIDGAGVRATALSRRFLEFSRPDNFEPKPTSLAVFLENAVPALQQIAAPNARVVLDPVDDRLFAMIDEVMLTKALVAVIQNASEALPAPGAVRLMVRAAARRDLGQTDSTRGATIPVVEIIVADRGRGMGPLMLEQAFEPGFTMKKSAGAPGMGLPTAYRIAREHGGEVEIFSKENVGTTVVFVLPRLLKMPEPDASSAIGPCDD